MHAASQTSDQYHDYDYLHFLRTSVLKVSVTRPWVTDAFRGVAGILPLTIFMENNLHNDER